jgi:hypothetical protein
MHGSDPYNPPHLPSRCSLTPPPSPLNQQFYLVLYFLTTPNLFFHYFPLFPLLLIMLHYRLTIANLSRDSFFLGAFARAMIFVFPLSSKLSCWIKVLFGVSHTLLLLPINYWIQLVLTN